MSTSLLYHAFGMRGYDYVSTRYVSGEVHFMPAQNPNGWLALVAGAGKSSEEALQKERFACRRWQEGPGVVRGKETAPHPERFRR